MKPKKDYMEKSRERLSAWIYDYVSKKEKENPQYGVAHFAKEVDAMLKVFFQCEDINNSKNVYKWTNKESLPDLPTMVAISKVVGRSIYELFESNPPYKLPLMDLTVNERKMMIEIIKQSKPLGDEEGLCASFYVPYAFKNCRDKRFLEVTGKLYSRDEVIACYQQLTEDAFKFNAMKDLGRNIKNIKEDLPLFLSVMVCENDGMGSIYYNPTDKYYDRMKEIWQKTNRYDVNNVICFEELVGEYNWGDVELFEKDPATQDKLYKLLAKIEENYISTFNTLIEKGYIQPLSTRKWEFEGDKESYLLEKRDIQTAMFMDFDELEPNDDYELQCLKFNFRICLTKNEITLEMREFVDAEVTDKFNGN